MGIQTCVSSPLYRYHGQTVAPMMVKNQAAEERIIPSPLSPNVFELPACPPSDCFLYNSVTSLNSLDNIPLAIFDSDDKGERDDTGSELRRNNEQTNSPNSTADRNSTESNDTGYTSSASPATMTDTNSVLQMNLMKTLSCQKSGTLFSKLARQSKARLPHSQMQLVTIFDSMFRWCFTVRELVRMPVCLQSKSAWSRTQMSLRRYSIMSHVNI